MNLKKMGDLLFKLRGKRTLGEVTKAIGVSEAAIRQYELGLQMPKDPVKERLAKYYNVGIQELFFPDFFLEKA